jgi:hypothetical protein
MGTTCLPELFLQIEKCKFKQKGRKNKNGKFTREPSDPGINAGQ